jgi:thiamine biosynthesis lipoprotein
LKIDPPNHPAPVLLARHAMATRFEIVLHGARPAALRAAGEEALDEIERWEQRLSCHRPDSEIAALNAHGYPGPVRLSPPVFRLLQWAHRLGEETKGAFDITVGPLMQAWGFKDGNGHRPPPQALAAARQQVGQQWLSLEEASFSARFQRPGLQLDLGAMGKGYAIEQAARVLREAGITQALLHGGTSTVTALGAPPGGAAWPVSIELPRAWQPAGLGSLAVVHLRDASLSVSAIWGKCFHEGESLRGHVLDPGSGEPVSGPLLAAITAPSATETDAFSTALLVAGEQGLGHITGLRPGQRGLVVQHNPAEGTVAAFSQGIELRWSAGRKPAH